MKASFCIDHCKSLMNCLRKLVLWLCALVGVAVLPEGCRAIPAGHFNFDPALALERGGRDGVAQAIIHEKIHGWLLHYEKRGRDYVYNNIDQWSEQLPFWHKGTVRKHIHELVECGYLDRERPGISAPSYYKQPVTKDSDGANQMLLWGDEKSLTVATKADHLQDTTPTRHKPPMVKRSITPPTPARATKPLNGGGVATFPPPRDDRDLPEKRPATPELRESSDEGDASMQASAIEGTPATSKVSRPIPSSAPPLSVHPDIRAFWIAIDTDAKLLNLVRTRGDDWTLEVIAYVQTQRCDSPQALARALLTQGFRPPQVKKYSYVGPWCANYLPPGAPPNPYPDPDDEDATEPDNADEGKVMA